MKSFKGVTLPMPVHAHPGVPDEQARPVLVIRSNMAKCSHTDWDSVDTTIAPEVLVSSTSDGTGHGHYTS